MALITCPDCENKISDLASQCLHCGRPMQSEDALKNPQSPPSNRANAVENLEYKSGRIITVDAETGSGSLRDDNSGEYIRFEENNVEGQRSLRGLSGSKIRYRVIGPGNVIVEPPENNVLSKGFSDVNSTQNSLRSETERGQSSAQDKVTKNYLWYLMVLVIAAGYWIAKGTPNPALFFAGSIAKEECLDLANENKGNIMLNENEITANDTWLKDGKRVVQLIQKTNDSGINQIMCVYGNGMVQIPSLLEQGRWR